MAAVPSSEEGEGEDPFPFRKELWRSIIRKSLPDRQHLLLCVYNYLETSGRKPNIRHLSWPATLNMSLDDLVRFYSSYFAIFRHEKDETVAVISDSLSRYAVGDRVRVSGTVSVSLIWWKNT